MAEAAEGRDCGYCVHCEVLHGLEKAVMICRKRHGFGGLWHAVRAGEVCGRFKVAPNGNRVGTAHPTNLPEGVRAVPLSQGKVALVDAGDYAAVMRFSWYAARSTPSPLLPIYRDLQGCLAATPSPLPPSLLELRRTGRGSGPLQGESGTMGGGLAATVFTPKQDASVTMGPKQDASVTLYAVRKAGGRTVRMHREILRAPRGLVVDHINHDGLDNRRCNLRVCSHAENIRNQRGQQGRSSRYKGVSRDRRLGKWRAQLWYAGRHYYLGVFGSEIAAAQAYNAKAAELFGEFAYLNGLTEPPPKIFDTD